MFKVYEYLHYWLNWHPNEHIRPLSRTERGMPEDLAHTHHYKDEHSVLPPPLGGNVPGNEQSHKIEQILEKSHVQK